MVMVDEWEMMVVEQRGWLVQVRRVAHQVPALAQLVVVAHLVGAATEELVVARRIGRNRARSTRHRQERRTVRVLSGIVSCVGGKRRV